MIISASIRCDIPAFYSDWFYNRIKAGFVYVRNPYYPSEIYEVSLRPDCVDLLVLWTKNIHPMLKRLDELNDYLLYFMITVTPYDRDIEPGVPLVKDVLKDIIYLSKKYGKERIALRYDPIIVNEKYTVDYHIFCFSKLCKILSGYIDDIIISFVDLYSKSKIVEEVKIEDRIRIANEFGKIGKQYHINIKTCAEISYEKYGIQKSGCLSKEKVESLLGTNIQIESLHSRLNCNCVPSMDIGEYDSCLHGCLYCYATNHTKAYKNYALHHIDSPLLIGEVGEYDVIKKIEGKSIIDPQLSLFWGKI